MTKLNKEQLKKLYDYGGTLSPKDWADMIDNMPENPNYNKDSLPIVKTTYAEVRELYYAGKMDPNVKYEFRYEFKSSPTTIYPVNNLKIYVTPSGNLKAEGAAEDNQNFYPFVADFEFDKLLVDYIPDTSGQNSDIYVYEDFKCHSLQIYDTNYEVFNILEQYNFEYEIKDDTEEFKLLLIKDVAVFTEDVYIEDMGENWYYINIINKSGIKIKYSPDSTSIIVDNINIKPIAAIYNIQYNDKFHYKLLDGMDDTYDYIILQCLASVYGSDHSDYIDWDSFTAQDALEIPIGVIINSQLSQIPPSIYDAEAIAMVLNSNFYNEF